MSLLILLRVVDPWVLGWISVKQVGTEIGCAEHKIIIPARNRHNGWVEEKLSVAIVQQVNYILDQLREARYMSSLDLKYGWIAVNTRIHRPYTGVSYPGQGTASTQQPI